MKRYLRGLLCFALVLHPAPAWAERDAVIAFRQFFATVAPLATQDFATILGPRDAFGNYNLALSVNSKMENCSVAHDVYWSLTCDIFGYGPERVGQLEDDITAALPPEFKRFKDVRGMTAWAAPSGVTVMLLQPESASDWMAVDIEHIAK